MKEKNVPCYKRLNKVRLKRIKKKKLNKGKQECQRKMYSEKGKEKVK